jgi:hypothetical protein
VGMAGRARARRRDATGSVAMSDQTFAESVSPDVANRASSATTPTDVRPFENGMSHSHAPLGWIVTQMSPAASPSGRRSPSTWR